MYGYRSHGKYVEAEVLKNPEYDVFLSLIGEEEDIGRELKKALVRSGLRTIISSNGQHDEIEKSRVVIIVFSDKYYLSSKIGMTEVVNIMDRGMQLGQFVLPVFYGVTPSNIADLLKFAPSPYFDWKSNGYSFYKYRWMESHIRKRMEQVAKLPAYYFTSSSHGRKEKSGKSVGGKDEEKWSDVTVARWNKKSSNYIKTMVEYIVSEVVRKVSNMAKRVAVKVPYVFSKDESEYQWTDNITVSGNLRNCLITEMTFTGFKQARPSIKYNPESLKILDLSHTQYLVKSPPFSRIRNLEALNLRGCVNMVEISESIELAERLSSLDLTDCKSLTNLPKNIQMLKFLEKIRLTGCSSLPEISLDNLDFEIGLNLLESLRHFNADGFSVTLLVTSNQANTLELEMDFSRRQGTISDIRRLFGLTQKCEVQKQIVVALMDLKVMYLTNHKFSKLPANLKCPNLEKLFLHSNSSLIDIPSSFFDQMPVLKVLDMSNTSIKSLPLSVSKLVKLEQLFLRGCKLLMELPPEIRALESLTTLDMEGTDLICLPKELGELIKLESLKVSLYGAESYLAVKGIVDIIPRRTLSKLKMLRELSINVDPHDVCWNAGVRTILEDLPSLRMLETLKLYIPTTELLQEFMKLAWNLDGTPIYQNLSHFCLIVGPPARRILSRVPHVLEKEFLKLDKCLTQINGKDNVIQFAQTLKYANALYLDRYWTIKNLSVFKLDEVNELKFCLLVDCNEMQSIFDGSEFSGGRNFKSLQYMSIHYLKNLELIWKGALHSSCFNCLTVLEIHMCPNLITIFTPTILQELVNLTDIVVEDCPKITTLVVKPRRYLQFLPGSNWIPLLNPQKMSKQFLPRLKKISLLNLPELVNISNGFYIGPNLERIVIYDCPKLKTLTSAEVCNKEIKEIKVGKEWWNSIEWIESGRISGRPKYLSCAYSPLEIDTDLMDSLCRNSLHLYADQAL